MTTDSFLNAFRRFIGRQGHPRLLRSDNGKNFVGARREMQACLNKGIAAVQNKIPHAEEICWDFNPPSAPHFGGPWEGMIQTAKRTLLIILGSQKLTLEFFTTILAETELMLNSRPLTHVNDQPENEEPLTQTTSFYTAHSQTYHPLFLKKQINHCLSVPGKKSKKFRTTFGNDS